MLTDLPDEFLIAHNILPNSHVEVIFAQDEKTAGQPFAYRDGVRLPNDTFLLMQQLPLGAGAYLVDDLAEGARPKALAAV